MENFKHLIRRPTLLLLAAMLPVCAWAWETKPTHPFLTQKMVACYNQKFAGPDLLNADTLKLGAVREDAAKYCYDRAFNHFYDPTTGGSGVSILDSLGFNDAVSWATDPSKQNGIVPSSLPWGLYCPNFRGGQSYPFGDMSFPTALALYDSDRSRALKDLGAVTHLLEDMAVPAHTRGDPHTEGDSLEVFAGWQTSRLGAIVCNPPVLNGANATDQLKDAMDRLATISNSGFHSDGSWSRATPYLAWTATGDTLEKNGRRYLYVFGELQIPASVYDGGETIPDHKIGQVSALTPREMVAGWIGQTPDPNEVKTFLVISTHVALDYYQILGRKAVEFGASVIDAYMKTVAP